MKHIYSILMLISLLFVGTACEDDYRDMVFFTGEAPIYQIGTCDNLIGSVNLWINRKVLLSVWMEVMATMS
mgnify:CR=1 FL=1